MVLPAYIDEETGEIIDGEAWVTLASTTLGSAAATVTFTSTNDGQVGDWSQYMDLAIIWYARCDNAGSSQTYLTMRFNNDTGGNYPYQFIRGQGSGTPNSGESASPTYILLGMYPEDSVAANLWAGGITWIHDINSGKNISSIGLIGDCQEGIGEGVWLTGASWVGQAAVAEIDITQLFGEDHKAGCRFDLFGILPRMVA